MALFVFISERCRRNADTHAQGDALLAFKQWVEDTQGTGGFDPFPPPYLVKKKFGGKRQNRLIAEHRTVGEHAVIVFLAIMIRGNREYKDEFARDARDYGQRHFVDVAPDDELLAYIDSRLNEDAPLPKPEPTGSEYALLYSAFSHQNDSVPDDIICETDDWVSLVGQPRIANQLALLNRTCLEALELESGPAFLPVAGKEGWGVWVLRQPERLLLVTISTPENALEKRSFAESLFEELSPADRTSLLRYSRRAYPALILADDDLWIELEREQEANMALSPEESEVLVSARCADSPFPLFINGRAGSGKSTILQYLFADLLFYHLTGTDQVSSPPLYLTASAGLLDIARRFVSRLLTREATFSPLVDDRIVSDNQAILDGAFRAFHPLLLSLVADDEELQSHFSSGARVDYSRFRQLWEVRFGRDRNALRDYGPDLSWHVIRSYIKGKSSETYLEPDDYVALPDNEITVTPAAYGLVYEKVWGWYQEVCSEKGLWDDQDLTRCILELDLAKPSYPAIFCDEAQDFTRLELELLLRLNLYSNRSLPPNAIGRIPFAFAGDQFQTLNPTGFRWDSVKASFVEKFIFALDPARQSGRTDLNYRELEYNYRSTASIVRFGNLIQAMRTALFQLPELRPQKPWSMKSAVFPVFWFRSHEAAVWNKLDGSDGYVFIVPCGEGEEATFVAEDPILRDHIRVEEGIPVNVLSPSRAKGCEYPAVVLYGFGENAPSDILSSIFSDDSSMCLDPDRSLPMQYFVNRLYVGVTRPKRRLIVLDTDAGIERLWRCALSQADEAAMLGRIRDGDRIWSGEVEGMTLGNPDDLSRESAGDPLENARSFEGEAKARRDGFLFRQAAQAYRSAGEMLKYRECSARASEADRRYLNAGEAFLDAGFISDGVRCLWRAGREGWFILRNSASRFPQILSDLEVRWAQTVTGVFSLQEAVDLLDALAVRLEEDQAFCDACRAEQAWVDALDALLEPLGKSLLSADSEPNVHRAVSLIDRIRSQSIRVPADSCAGLYFAARRYVEAVAMWEAAGTTRSTQYHQAKASIEPYPQRVVALAKLGLDREILDAYAEAPETVLTPEQVSVLVGALARLGHVQSAFDLAWRKASSTGMLELARTLFEAGRLEPAQACLCAAVRCFVRQEHWADVTGFAVRDRLGEDPVWRTGDGLKWLKSRLDLLRNELVRELARSDGLLSASEEHKRQIAEFLRSRLRLKVRKQWDTVSIEEAGAAIERAGRFTDALMFYEAVRSDRRLRGSFEFVERRWLVCKERQFGHFEMLNNSAKASDAKQAITTGLARLNLKGIGALDQYPALSPLAPPSPLVSGPGAVPIDVVPVPVEVVDTSNVSSSEASERVSFSVGLIRAELSRRLGRCNLSHNETLESARVLISERRVDGEVSFDQVSEGTWVSSVWKITIELPPDSSDQIIRVIDHASGNIVGIDR